MNLGGLYYAFNAPGCFVWARVLPSGRVFCLRDFRFKQQSIETVVADVKRQTAEMGTGRLAAIYAPPEMFPKPTQGERRILEAETPSQTFARFGLPLVAAGSNAIHGWQRIQDFLRDAPDGKPWLMLSPECKWLRRTLPTLVQTKTDPDDCEGETYAAHALRALLSSRPQPSAKSKPPVRYAWNQVGALRDEPTRRGVLSR
jgi:hypothetical protein